MGAAAGEEHRLLTECDLQAGIEKVLRKRKMLASVLILAVFYVPAFGYLGLMIAAYLARTHLEQTELAQRQERAEQAEESKSSPAPDEPLS